ncbi:MAG: hypothetical protein GY859_11200 [Desulfobacterales bacterium]|nr:hypothetical protein [Desulfobacterales bacterium]
MVKIKYILIVVLAVAAGVYALLHFLESEENRIKKRFKVLAEVISRDSEENKLALVVKTSKLQRLLAPKCTVDYPARSISRTYTPKEISQIVTRVLLQYSECFSKFYDIGVEITGETRASAVFTVKLTGELPSGEYAEDIREVESELQKIEGEWMFNSFTLVDVLEK